MLEILKQQYESGRALSQKGYKIPVKLTEMNSGFYMLYPMIKDYYHELNPFFLFNMFRNEWFHFAKTITVRDGANSLALFLLKNVTNISNLRTHFIIHQDLASLVPVNLRHSFSVFNVVQSNKKKLEEAKNIIIFAMGIEQYFTSLDIMPEKIKALKGIAKDASIEVVINSDKNPFEKIRSGNMAQAKVINYLNTVLGERNLKFSTSEELIERFDFNDTYFIDLASDRFMFADNFLEHFVASKGGTIDSFKNSFSKENVMNFKLSLNHDIEICPFPDVESVFMDLLLYSKKTNIEDLMFDQIFQSLLRDKLK